MGATNLPVRPTRCAIYTRKSIEYGLDQEFNSLEAQRAICSAYIASQRPKGWVELEKRYDDGAQSGATLVRPALQDMLADLENGLIDVVVIYKLDRMTRTLLDFVRLLDLFERFGVTFISVTQRFDTSDSTGRLILNILLTFAQFEREIMSDRLKDKFGQMRARGLFVGGHPPFGYDLIDKKLVVNDGEAKIVRAMFERYLEIKSYQKVADEFTRLGIRRRERISKRGLVVPGRQIEQSSVWHMLGNATYVGEVTHRGVRYPGVHEAIVSRKLWDAVQKLRTRRTREKVVQIHKADFLRGLMFDCFGRRIGLLRDYRATGRGYRYYISNQTEWGRRHGVRRLRTNADELEELVLASISAFLADRRRTRSLLLGLGFADKQLDKLSKRGSAVAALLAKSTPRQIQFALKAIVERIELSEERLKIVLRVPEIGRFLGWDGVGLFHGNPSDWDRPHSIELIDVPAATVRMKRFLALPVKQREPGHEATPNPRLVALIRRARSAQALLDSNRSEEISSLAVRVGTGPTRFARLVRLNYLAPDIITSILDGTQPKDLTRRRLTQSDIPMDWTLQRRLFGFPEQPDYLKGQAGY